MAVFIEQREKQLLDALSDPDIWIKRNPQYAERFKAIAELRNHHVEQGTHLKTPEWKHVASIIGPLNDVQRILDPGFLQNDRKFYGWLDRNPWFCTYDRRKTRRSQWPTVGASRPVNPSVAVTGT